MLNSGAFGHRWAFPRVNHPDLRWHKFLYLLAERHRKHGKAGIPAGSPRRGPGRYILGSIERTHSSVALPLAEVDVPVETGAVCRGRVLPCSCHGRVSTGHTIAVLYDLRAVVRFSRANDVGFYVYYLFSVA